MTFDQAIVEVRQICGWRQDQINESANAIRYSQAERELPGRTYPWFLRGFSLITTTAGVASYALPADYIQDLDDERDGVLFAYTGALFQSRPIFLKKYSFRTLQEKSLGVWPAGSSTPTSDVQRGRPTGYSLGAGGMDMYPIPDAAYQIIWNYWKKDAIPNPGLENLWLANAPWLLIGDAAWKISKDLGYKEGQETALALIQKSETELFKANVYRQDAGRKRSMGSRL